MKSLAESVDMTELAKAIFGMTAGDASISEAIKALGNIAEDEDDRKALEAEVNETKKASDQKIDVVKELETRLEKNQYYMPVNTISELEMGMKMLMNRLWNGGDLFCIVAEGYALTGLSDDSTQITLDKEKIDKFKKENGEE